MTPERAYVAYLDGTLTPEELAFVNRMLADDPAWRSAWCECGLQAAAVHEYMRLAAEPVRRRTRTGLRVATAVASLAAAVAVAVVWTRPVESPAVAVAEIESVGDDLWRVEPTGDVRVQPGTPARPGETYRTAGFAGGAILRFADGSRVALAGDTSVTVGTAGEPLVRVHRGNISADVRPRSDGKPVRFETADAVVDLPRDRVTVACGNGRTEVVADGDDVRVSARGRTETLAVRPGEVVAVADGQAARSAPMLPLPETWEANFSLGLPPRWERGLPFVDPARGSVVAATPIWVQMHQRTHHQIVSNNGWTNGLFPFRTGMAFTADVKLERPGVVQLLVVARRPDSAFPFPAIVFDKWDVARGLPAGEWHTIKVPFHAMKPTRPADVPPEMVGFHVVLDTLGNDLGLTVARMAVAPE